MANVVLPEDQLPITVVFSQWEFSAVLNALEEMAARYKRLGDDETCQIYNDLRKDLWNEER